MWLTNLSFGWEPHICPLTSNLQFLFWLSGFLASTLPGQHQVVLCMPVLHHWTRWSGLSPAWQLREPTRMEEGGTCWDQFRPHSEVFSWRLFWSDAEPNILAYWLPLQYHRDQQNTIFYCMYSTGCYIQSLSSKNVQYCKFCTVNLLYTV